MDSQTAISPAALVNINGQFDGARHGHFFRKKYYNPTPAAKARRVPALGDVESLNSHRDILRRKIERPLDLERGIDPFDGKLRRIVIQAGGQQYNAEQGPWRRRRIKSNASWRLRFSGWLLGPGAFDEDYQPNGAKSSRALLGSSSQATRYHLWPWLHSLARTLSPHTTAGYQLAPGNTQSMFGTSWMRIRTTLESEPE